MYTSRPIVEEIDAGPDALIAFALGSTAERRPIALDSGSAAADGRWLFVARDPFAVLDGSGDPLEALDTVIARNACPPVLDGVPAGFAVGALAYDVGRRYERVPATARTDAPCPEAAITCYDALLAHDYRSRRTYAISTGRPDAGAAGEARAIARLRTLVDGLRTARPAEPTSACAASPTSNFTPDAYAAAVERVKAHIAAGDVYQVNMTQRFTSELRGLEPAELFARLRRRNPASFAAFLAAPGRAIVSASPERFLRMRGRDVEMWPIKGTRPRGTDEAEDGTLADELLGSAKDRAENVMIVDLVRNDLGRVAEFGSVRVDELCALRTLPTVFHLVSRVSARVRPGATRADVLRAVFPCGSITGAPKIRAMEIIESLEGVRRGLSMGAIGYASFDGAMDWNVAIRTIDVVDGVARFNVGGGVVADSDPAGEYEESMWKARALIDALTRA